MSTEKSRSARSSRSLGPPRRGAVPTAAVPLPKTIGKYTVQSRLGVGAMGVVYKCTQPGLNRPVAVKVLNASKHTLGDVLPRFQREARAASRLNHPNVVQVYDIGTEGELHYIVMEFVDGNSLDKLISTPTLTVDSTLRILIHVARALQAAHQAGIVHRDIKPSNILIPRSGPPKLADFGLAKSLHDGPTLSRSGDILGTPRYMSPEQVLMSPKDLDNRTDIYSLGAVMYEMLTGKPPVDGPNVMAMLRSLTDEEPVPIRQRNPNVPEAVAAICQKALAKDRDQRYATAAEMAQDMQNYLLEKLLGSPALVGAPVKPGNGESIAEPNWNGSTEPRRTRLFLKMLRLPLGIVGFLFRKSKKPILALVLLCVLAMIIGMAAWPSWLTSLWNGNGSTADNLPALELLILQSREHLEETTALHASATPRERYQALVADLTAAIKRSPHRPEIRSLRGRAYRLGGEFLACIDDVTAYLRHHPDDRSARLTRLLAGYQLHVLYIGNFKEVLLRSDSETEFHPDLNVLLGDEHPIRRRAAQIIDRLANHDYAAAADLAEGLTDPPPADLLADLAMLQADALYQAAGSILIEEQSASDDRKPELKQRREEMLDRAGKALQRGLNADPHHVGLLVLLANSIPRQADGEGADRDRFLARHRPEFDKACDRLRNVTLRQGCETPIARAVLWNNYGRPDMALDQIKDALSCRPGFRHLFTVKAWLRMQVQPDGILAPEEASLILGELQPVFETPPDTYHPYFVRALLETARGKWDNALTDLHRCARLLEKYPDRNPSHLSYHNQWYAQANQSMIAYLDATQVLLDVMPVAHEVRTRLAEEVLRCLNDTELVRRDNLSQDQVRDKLARTHYRLARMFAERKVRSEVLKHIRMTLEQRMATMPPAIFRDDPLFGEWNNDPEFQEMYRPFGDQE